MDVSGKVHGATAWAISQESSVLTAQEVACAPEPFWMTWRTEKSTQNDGYQNKFLVDLAHKLDIAITLSQF